MGEFHFIKKTPGLVFFKYFWFYVTSDKSMHFSKIKLYIFFCSKSTTIKFDLIIIISPKNLFIFKFTSYHVIGIQYVYMLCMDFNFMLHYFHVSNRHISLVLPTNYNMIVQQTSRCRWDDSVGTGTLFVRSVFYVGFMVWWYTYKQKQKKPTVNDN